jgi:molybdopterin-binding protein
MAFTPSSPPADSGRAPVARIPVASPRNLRYIWVDISTTPNQHRGNAVKLSARNIIKGKIVEVKKGQTTAHVRIDIGGAVVTASITNESVDELKLAPGQSAYAVIKSSDVMIGVE